MICNVLGFYAKGGLDKCPLTVEQGKVICSVLRFDARGGLVKCPLKVE